MFAKHVSAMYEKHWQSVYTTSVQLYDSIALFLHLLPRMVCAIRLVHCIYLQATLTEYSLKVWKEKLSYSSNYYYVLEMIRLDAATQLYDRHLHVHASKALI